MAWNVKTLDKENFAAACHELQELVADSGFHPDAVVGIRTGGLYVAEKMFETIPHYYTELQRPSTKLKHNGLKYIFRYMPGVFKDGLRILESRILSKKKKRDLSRIVIEINPALPHGIKNILIVDDAVDSGNTLSIVRDAVSELFPEAKIVSAVITVTTASPFIRPEYFLYNRVLVRFPWSLDA